MKTFDLYRGSCRTSVRCWDWHCLGRDGTLRGGRAEASLPTFDWKLRLLRMAAERPACLPFSVPLWPPRYQQVNFFGLLHHQGRLSEPMATEPLFGSQRTLTFHPHGAEIGWRDAFEMLSQTVLLYTNDRHLDAKLHYSQNIPWRQRRLHVCRYQQLQQNTGLQEQQLRVHQSQRSAAHKRSRSVFSRPFLTFSSSNLFRGGVESWNLLRGHKGGLP